MLVLFDHVTRSRFARPRRHDGQRTGWDTLSNGDLLATAEQAGFDVLLTADKNMRYQQNLEGRRIALVVLSTPQWPVVKLHLGRIAAAVNAAAPGSYTEVELPAIANSPLTAGLAGGGRLQLAMALIRGHCPAVSG
jgi:hypothetical protein